MEAYCPHEGRDFSVSRYQVIEASQEAELWVSGFLHGNEPSPPEDDGLRFAWRGQVEAFHTRGVWE
jgi:hypothetical protein